MRAYEYILRDSYPPLTPQARNFNALQVRTLTDEKGNPWFVAVDVCRVLEHSNPTLALRYFDKSERANKNLGLVGMAQANVISESGLYKLIMRSNKPQANPE